MKVGLHREDGLCQSKCVVGVNWSRLKQIQPQPLVQDMEKPSWLNHCLLPVSAI